MRNFTDADDPADGMPPARSRIVTRLAAFILLCVGVQVLLTGVHDALAPLLAVPR